MCPFLRFDALQRFQGRHVVRNVTWRYATLGHFHRNSANTVGSSSRVGRSGSFELPMPFQVAPIWWNSASWVDYIYVGERGSVRTKILKNWSDFGTKTCTLSNCDLANDRGWPFTSQTTPIRHFGVGFHIFAVREHRGFCHQIADVTLQVRFKAD